VPSPCAVARRSAEQDLARTRVVLGLVVSDVRQAPRSTLARGDISYVRGKAILDSAGVVPVWDSVQKAPHAEWEVHGVFRHAWLEDARAFMAKLELVNQYHLRGYSVWVLGTEDDAVWGLLEGRH